VDCVGDIFDHYEKIGYSKTGENHISRRLHLATCQYSNVEDIGNRAEYTHQQTGPSVYLHVPIVEGLPSRTAVLDGRRGCRREVQGGIHPCEMK